MTATEVNTKTIFTFELNYGTWYIDHNTDKDVQYPYSVHRDEHYVGSRKTVGEAFEIIAKTIGNRHFMLRSQL